MNVLNTIPKKAYFYFPIGNTRPASLTQDLPAEQDADILLLGCGDARHILFTCFADNARQIDVTCCDIQPMIHVRNVLLFTLLIDDVSNHNCEQIWNIYYNWKIDQNSLKLLESQTEKLKQVSNSVDEWNSSAYGANIRFCDEKSLSLVRCYWLGFTSEGLSAGEKKSRLEELQAAIQRAKDNRYQAEGPDVTGYQALFPHAIYQDTKGMQDLCGACKEWWDSGRVKSSNSHNLKSTHLNPALLYSPPKHPHTIYFGMSPLGGVPLCTAYISVCKDSPLYVQNSGKSATEHLVDCAKSHFAQWAPAFRRSIKNGSKIRIFSGHAFNFCFTLRNCQLTQSRIMNMYCHGWTSSPLILHQSDYSGSTNTAPVSFDVIDTSNLADYLGPLNVVALASSLLKYHVSSCLYTELMVTVDFSLVDRVRNLFGVDVKSMALFLGLVAPDLFTNATNTVEESPDICNFRDEEPGKLSPW